MWNRRTGKLLEKINFLTVQNWHELRHMQGKVMCGDYLIKNCGRFWKSQIFINYHISVCMAWIIGWMSEASSRGFFFRFGSSYLSQTWVLHQWRGKPMKANLNPAGDPWDPRSGTDGSGSAAAVEANAALALSAHASSRAATLLRRRHLPLDRPFCFYALCPSLCTSTASHIMCVCLFGSSLKAGIFPFHRFEKWGTELNLQISRHVQICKSIQSRFSLSPNIQIHLNVISLHLDTKYGRAANHKIQHSIEFLK